MICRIRPRFRDSMLSYTEIPGIKYLALDNADGDREEQHLQGHLYSSPSSTAFRIPHSPSSRSLSAGSRSLLKSTSGSGPDVYSGQRTIFNKSPEIMNPPRNLSVVSTLAVGSSHRGTPAHDKPTQAQRRSSAAYRARSPTGIRWLMPLINIA